MAEAWPEAKVDGMDWGVAEVWPEAKVDDVVWAVAEAWPEADIKSNSDICHCGMRRICFY